MKRWKKPALWAAAAVVLLMLFVAFVLPGIVKTQAIKGIEKATGRKTAISDISLNPITWTARIEGFQLMEKGEDAVFVSFKRAKVSLSPFSVFRMAPLISQARIVSPYVRIVRTAPNSYNFSDLLKGKKKKSDKPLRFSLNNIIINNGSIDFIDRALPTEKSHTLRKMEVGVPFISNMKYYADQFVQPYFRAVINGSPFKLEGKLRPFLKGAETSIDINLKDLSLPFYFSYYPGEPPVRMESGRLTTRLGIVHRVREGKEPELEINGDVILDRIAVNDRGGAPLFSLKRGETRIAKADVISREFNIDSLSFDAPEVHLSRDKAGVWNLQRLTEKEEKPVEKPKVKKPLVFLSETKVANGRVLIDDTLPPGGFTGEINAITFTMHGFSTAHGKKGNYSLSFATPREESGEFRGEFSIEPLTLETTADLKEIDLEAYYPYLAEKLTAAIKGRMDVAAGIAVNPEEGPRLTKLDMEIRKLEAPFIKGEGAKVDRIVLNGARASLKERSAEVDAVEFSDGNIRLSRDAKGNISPLALLKKENKGKSAAKPEKKDAPPPFNLTLKKVAASGFNISFTDRMKEMEPVFLIKKLRFSLDNITAPRFNPIPFDMAAGYGKKGSISVRGSVEPKPLKIQGACVLKRIPITDAGAYLPDDLNITIADGLLDTKLGFSLSRAGEALAGNFRGSMGISSFNSLDADDHEFLKWESLQLDNIRGGLNPFSLNISGVSLSRFYSRIIVNKDGTLNLQEIRGKGKKAETAKEDSSKPQSTAHPTPVSSPSPPPASKKGLIKVGTVTMQDGTIAFIDHHTKPEYSSTMVNLGGRVSGLSSEVNTTADVDLRGNLENHSPLRITGRINPLRDDLFVDLKVSFTDIELSPLTPYSGTYLGYAVDKGKLFLDLKYHIENKSLDASNNIFIDQFTFGNRVESDKATSLPVRLAVALLKDRKGEIHLDLPLTGRTDDPQFSIWGVVWKILKNLLVKAATSPFALLQSIFGGKEDFSNVQFAYGSAKISDPERAKLAKLSQIITDRPALKLEVGGFVDQERDPEGYRNELLTKKMKNEKYLALVKSKKVPEGATAEKIEILPQEYSQYLKAVYRKEKFPKPRNFIGMLKDLPDDEMKKLILANTVVGRNELEALARDRAVAVRNFLITEGKLPPERVFEKKGDITKAPEEKGESGARVEFGVATD